MVVFIIRVLYSLIFPLFLCLFPLYCPSLFILGFYFALLSILAKYITFFATANLCQQSICVKITHSQVECSHIMSSKFPLRITYLSLLTSVIKTCLLFFLTWSLPTTSPQKNDHNIRNKCHTIEQSKRLKASARSYGL